MIKHTYIHFIWLVSIVLQLIPNIYILGVRNTLFTTNVLSLLAVILVFLLLLPKSEFQKILNESKTEFLLVLFFIFSQCLSLISAVSLPTSLRLITNHILGVIILFVSRYFYSRSLKQKSDTQSLYLNRVLIGTTLLNILYQLTLKFYPYLLLPFITNYFSRNLFEVTKFHYIDNKIYSNFPIEITVPFFFFLLLNKKKIFQKMRYVGILLFIFALAILSNFRYRFLSFLLAIMLSLIIYHEYLKKQFKYVGIFLLLLMLTVSIFSISTNVSTTLNRIVDTQEYGQESTIAFRIEMYRTAIDLGMQNILGVGLGNMYDYLPKMHLHSAALFPSESHKFSLLGGAHNFFLQTFAETGILGITSLLVLLGFWLWKDITVSIQIKHKKVYILMFWTLLLISQFIPTYNTTFFYLFFLLRGII